jgi:hypothetical protein
MCVIGGGLVAAAACGVDYWLERRELRRQRDRRAPLRTWLGR